MTRWLLVPVLPIEVSKASNQFPEDTPGGKGAPLGTSVAGDSGEGGGEAGVGAASTGAASFASFAKSRPNREGLSAAFPWVAAATADGLTGAAVGATPAALGSG